MKENPPIYGSSLMVGSPSNTHDTSAPILPSPAASPATLAASNPSSGPPSKPECKDQQDRTDKAYETLLDLMKRRFDGEVDRRSELDGKAGRLVGYVTIVTGLLVGLGSFSVSNKLSSPQYYVPFFLGIIFLLTSIITSLKALQLRAWRDAPSIDQLENHFLDDSEDYTGILMQSFRSMAEAVKKNFNYNQDKAGWVAVSWFFLIFGIGAFVAYSSIFAYSFNPKQSETKITIEGNATVIKELLTKMSNTGPTVSKR